MIVEVPGTGLWTESQGAGVPLVLCHGGPGLSDNLGPVAEMVDDLESLRRRWGHERWLVGGHSWGANLALIYALTHPDRTIGVIYLAGSGLRPEGREAARRGRLARLTEAEREELATTTTERFLELTWTTDFADRRQVRLPLYRWPRDESIFAAVTRSFQDLVGLPGRVRRLGEPAALRAFIRDPFGRKLLAC